MWHICMHLFNKYIPSTYSDAGAALASQDMSENKADKHSFPQAVYIPVDRKEQTKTIT